MFAHSTHLKQLHQKGLIHYVFSNRLYGSECSISGGGGGEREGKTVSAITELSQTQNIAGLLKYTISVSANKLITDNIHLDKDISVSHDMTVDSV